MNSHHSIGAITNIQSHFFSLRLVTGFIKVKRLSQVPVTIFYQIVVHTSIQTSIMKEKILPKIVISLGIRIGA